MTALWHRPTVELTNGYDADTLLALQRGAHLGNRRRFAMPRPMEQPTFRKTPVRAARGRPPKPKRTIIPPVKAAIEAARPKHVAPAIDRLKQIASIVAECFGVERAAMISPRRFRTLAYARRAYCVLAKSRTGMSNAAIGRAVGMNDPSSVVHAISEHARTMRVFEEYALRFLEAESRLSAG